MERRHRADHLLIVPEEEQDEEDRPKKRKANGKAKVSDRPFPP